MEDDEGSALLVQVALGELGADIAYQRVNDVDQALQFLSASSNGNGTKPKPDLILLDLNLPGTSGFEILSAVRAAPLWRNTAVVIFTSSSAPRDMETASALHATKYMLKPSTFEGYLDTIGDLLEVLANVAPDQPPD